MAFKVNFSDREASSQAREFDAIPSGKYYARITDVEDRECSEESKNAGKPYWNIEFTIQEGPYVDRKVWTNCMLFEGALYTLSQLLKATGFEHAIAPGDVPDGDVFITKEVLINVKKGRNAYMEARNGDGEPVWSNEVKGILSYTGTSPAGGVKSSSLLP